MDSREHPHGVSLVFDAFDIDLLVKVLSHTVFSTSMSHPSYSTSEVRLPYAGPFFVFFIPVFYIFHGARLNDPIVVTSALFFVVISFFCEQDAIAIQMNQLDQNDIMQGSSNGTRSYTVIKAACYLRTSHWIGVNRSSS